MRLLPSHRDGHEFACSVSAENATVGERGLHPAASAEEVLSGEFLVAGGRWVGEDEVPGFRKDEQFVASDDERTALHFLRLPFEFAAGEINAGERGFRVRSAINAIDVTADEDG